MNLQSLEADPDVEIIPSPKNYMAQLLSYSASDLTKNRGMIDGMSCVVMQERGLSEILTTDEHFAQMSFYALLK